MSKPRLDPPFTFIPIDIAPIDCPRCGAKADVVRRSPCADNPKNETRTFRCSRCGEETPAIAREGQ